MERRDGNADGLIEYGSSPTGTGAFVHTKQGAMDESFMDNAPIFDRAGFDPDAHTLTMAEPGLNASSRSMRNASRGSPSFGPRRARPEASQSARR